MNVSPDLILKQSRRTRQSKARMIFCSIAISLGFPTRKMGDILGIQQAAISNAGRKVDK